MARDVQDFGPCRQSRPATDSRACLLSAAAHVTAARAALEAARRAHRPPSELRGVWHDPDRARDAAVAEVRSRGHEALRRARTARELHRLAALSHHELRLPNVARAASRGATGPHLAGMVLDPTPPVGQGSVPSYGLDLAAELDGRRPNAAAVRVPGPRSPADTQRVVEDDVRLVGAAAD